MHNGRFASLLAQKAQLESEIHREMNVPLPDQVRISTLKKRKVMVNDQLNRISSSA
jgi:hypothetical protein